MEFIEKSFESLGIYFQTTLPEGPFNGLITKGIIGGVGSVLVFIPQIAVLFLFIGIMEEYNVAVDQINSFNTHAEAESYISNLQGIYKWNRDEPAALNFLELVQRRFL